jgi:hypothetical protein
MTYLRRQTRNKSVTILNLISWTFFWLPSWNLVTSRSINALFSVAGLIGDFGIRNYRYCDKVRTKRWSEGFVLTPPLYPINPAIIEGP